MSPENVEVGEAEKAAIDEEEQEAVEEEEAEVDEDAGGEVFDVDLNADAGGDVADNGLRDAIDADGLVGEGVLKQADGGSGKSAGDRVAAGDGEKDSDDQGQIENG